MRMRLAAAGLALAALTGPAWAQNTIHETEEADFRVETVASGLEFPWSLAFLPRPMSTSQGPA